MANNSFGYRCTSLERHEGPHSWYSDRDRPPGHWQVDKVNTGPEAQLAQWWRDVAEEEIDKVVPKAVEYSAHDLALLGEWMRDLIEPHRNEGSAPSVVADAELACWFYLAGKLGRAMGALREGRAPSDDTLEDIGIYCRMAQRIRQAGSWPGTGS